MTISTHKKLEAALNHLCYELEIDDLIDDGLDDEEA